MRQKVKQGDFIKRKYGIYVSQQILQVDDVAEEGVWAHRVKVDTVGSQWIPMPQVIVANEKVLKLSISAEDAEYLAKSHNNRLDHTATKQWLEAANGKLYDVVLLRNVAKQKEIFVSNATFIKTLTYAGKPLKKTIGVRIVFETYLRMKV